MTTGPDTDRPTEVADEAGDDVVAARRRWLRAEVIRRVAISAWVIGFVTQLAVSGLVTDRYRTTFWAMTAVMAFSVGRRNVWVAVVDFVPLGAVLLAWDNLRGLADTFGMPTVWKPQIRFDRAVFGVEPTVWLQAHLRYATPRWWDAPIALVYISFFFVPLTTAVVLWLRERRQFQGWVARYVAISFIGFVIFALMPSAPPWAAGKCSAQQVANHPADPPCMQQSARLTNGGLLGPLPHPKDPAYPFVHRSSGDGLEVMHLHVAKHLFDVGARASDPVAGIPSLHAGVALLFTLFLWRRMRRWWTRAIVAAYPPAMGFVLMYNADHYLIDILAGWALAIFVSVVAGRIERRLDGRRARRAADKRAATPAATPAPSASSSALGSRA